MLGADGYKTKKELKAAIGKPLRCIETSYHGEEYKSNGVVTMVGPCAHTKRTWYARITMENDLIKRVE